MPLAIFDLDETLISSDSDYLWGEFVVARQLVDEHEYRRKNHEFYEQYKDGTLDVYAYLQFACAVLARHDQSKLIQLRSEFVETHIKPLVLPRAVEVVDAHRRQGDHLLVITSTMEFITRPIVELFNIDDLIAPIPEEDKGRFTGRIEGVPSFGKGKVERLEAWLEGRPYSLDESWFYSDSINDLPLLKRVGHPVAVDPDERLDAEAKQRGWKITSFRND